MLGLLRLLQAAAVSWASFVAQYLGIVSKWTSITYLAAIFFYKDKSELWFRPVHEIDQVMYYAFSLIPWTIYYKEITWNYTFDIITNISDLTDKRDFALVIIARLLAVIVLELLAIWLAFLGAGFLFGIGRRLLGHRPAGARFASRWELFRARDAQGDAFGHYGGNPLLLHTDKHVLIQASTRGGKGVALIIPHLLRHSGSAFVLDPKGENARATGRRRATLNKTVHYLDPFGISGKPPSRFNPLARFTPENMEAESKALAAALIFRDRDHWIGSAQQLLAAIILHVVTSPNVPPEKRDLVTVRDRLLGYAKETLKAMTQSEGADGLVAALANSFLSTPERELGSIISTAQRETEILDNKFIQRCLSATGDTPEVDFSQWHRDTMTVFLCLSAPKFPVFSGWLRLVLTSALNEMTERQAPPKKPVCFMLDELATLGHLPVVENAVGLAAGYGVQLITVFQDVAQMRDLYESRWASFIGNAGIRVVFNLADFDTARYWSDFIGQHTIKSVSESRNIYGVVQSDSASDALRSLLTPEELMLRYASGKMLVLKQGMRPIEAARVPYWDDRQLAGLWDDPREFPPTAGAASASVEQERREPVLVAGVLPTGSD